MLVFSACGQGDSNVPGDEFASSSDALTVCAATELQGVDVSSYQGSINWGSVAAAGIKWGYAKATEGTGYDDPTFPRNWSGMKSAGIYRGAYHFFHPGTDGRAQADHFLAYANSIGAGDLPPMLDWEVTDGVSGSTAAANAQAFINEIQARIGRKTVIYTTPGLWASFHIPVSFGANPLWVADWLYCYGGSCCPIMPSGWTDWVFWQWTDSGSVSGIPATVDRDVFKGDLSALAAFAGGSTGGGGGGGGTCNGPNGHPVGSGGAVGAGCTGGGTPGLPPQATNCGGISPGDGLGPGESISSCDGRFVLVMQTDGNVVLYSNGIALWSTGTGGTQGYMFVMQGDGNLVLYGKNGCPMWASNTAGHNGAYLALQGDGNLVVCSAGGSALWSTGTGAIGGAPPACGSISPGDGLAPGESLSACGGCFNLVMQSDGNLVLYRNNGQALWSTGTNGKGGYALDMQGDGNAVLYSNAGCALWSSNTGGHSNSFLAVQDDGNVVVYSANGQAIWASNTDVCPGGCQCLPALTISPTSPTVPPRGKVSFSASGGSGGYRWSMASAPSGGSISSSGAYTAGSTPNVSDTVQVTDSFGHKATATVHVGAGVTISPASANLFPKGSVTFSASGGSGSGFTWSMASAPSGGTITSAGVYTAGTTGSVTDTVQVVDSLGNSATATIKVGPGLIISPVSPTVAPRGSLTFTASGGSGTGYTWALTTSNSGGSITTAGAYTAGATGSVNDAVTVTDSLGNVATVQVNVGPVISISPGSPMVPPLGSLTLTAAGGSGTGYTWSLVSAASGGKITRAGAYTAGPTGSVVDAAQVVDSLGNSATVAILVGPGLSIVPAAPMVPPRGSLTLSAMGGSGTGFRWSMETAPSGGTITSAGVYTAGSTGNVTDVVQVIDSLGNITVAPIAVGPGVSITPDTITVAPQQTVTFSATGGSGTGFTWSLASSMSEGTITSDGTYTAGTLGNVTDTVQVTDSLGNTAQVQVMVGPDVSILPVNPLVAPRQSVSFSAMGGSGTGFVWSLIMADSGGSLTSDGTYTAGATPSTTDVVSVVDSLGNTATATVNVGLGVSITAPATSVPPRGSLDLTASGGSNTGFTWLLITNQSNGTVSDQGVYTAGSVGNVTDTVQLTDSLGNTATVDIKVGPQVSVTPMMASVDPMGSVTFTAFGGSGVGYQWSVPMAPSGGSITSGGVYTAGPVGNTSDFVAVTDSLGNMALAQVSVGAGITITPPPNVLPPRGSFTFSAMGGSGTGYTWTLTSSLSGGTITSAGVYTAGSTGNSVDVVSVTDSLGNVASVNVNVGPGISIAPETAMVAPLGSITFQAVGGSGTGYAWMLSAAPSGGLISSTGEYRAGAMGGVTDTVLVTDSLGNTATVEVTVGPGLSISPTNPSVAPLQSVTFSVSGGSGTGYTWALGPDASGATISADGVYTAGRTGNAVDRLQVTDSSGNTASVNIQVGPGVSITPAMDTVGPLQTVRFSAMGGSGTGYTWSLTTAPSGGTITSGGSYTAGATADVSDVVQVQDSLGNTATATITISTQQVADGGTDGGTSDATDGGSRSYLRMGGCGCAGGGTPGSLALAALMLGRALVARRRRRV